MKTGKIIYCDVDQDTPVINVAQESEPQVLTENIPDTPEGDRKLSQVPSLPGKENEESEPHHPIAVPPKKKKKLYFYNLPTKKTVCLLPAPPIQT